MEEAPKRLIPQCTTRRACTPKPIRFQTLRAEALHSEGRDFGRAPRLLSFPNDGGLRQGSRPMLSVLTVVLLANSIKHRSRNNRSESG